MLFIAEFYLPSTYVLVYLYLCYILFCSIYLYYLQNGQECRESGKCHGIVREIQCL